MRFFCCIGISLCNLFGGLETGEYSTAMLPCIFLLMLISIYTPTPLHRGILTPRPAGGDGRELLPAAHRGLGLAPRAAARVRGGRQGGARHVLGPGPRRGLLPPPRRVQVCTLGTLNASLKFLLLFVFIVDAFSTTTVSS